MRQEIRIYRRIEAGIDAARTFWERHAFRRAILGLELLAMVAKR
jgi:hypothetical protein